MNHVYGVARTVGHTSLLTITRSAIAWTSDRPSLRSSGRMIARAGDVPAVRSFGCGTIRSDDGSVFRSTGQTSIRSVRSAVQSPGRAIARPYNRPAWRSLGRHSTNNNARSKPGHAISQPGHPLNRHWPCRANTRRLEVAVARYVSPMPSMLCLQFLSAL